MCVVIIVVGVMRYLQVASYLVDCIKRNLYIKTQGHASRTITYAIADTRMQPQLTCCVQLANHKPGHIFVLIWCVGNVIFWFMSGHSMVR